MSLADGLLCALHYSVVQRQVVFSRSTRHPGSEALVILGQTHSAKCPGKRGVAVAPMPNATESRAQSRAAAEKLKAEGNVAYQKQKWGAAVDVRILFTLPCRIWSCVKVQYLYATPTSSSVVM